MRPLVDRAAERVPSPSFSPLCHSLAQAKEKAKAKVIEKVEKCNLTTITQLLDAFDLSKEGKKEDKVLRLVEFLESPKVLGTKDLAAIVRAAFLRASIGAANALCLHSSSFIRMPRGRKRQSGKGKRLHPRKERPSLRKRYFGKALGRR